ncbi:MAG: chemotaxis protein [Planctomycetota bacterium]|nr:MAG: chemotaxis protein [Planctomycetota bacterium]
MCRWTGGLISMQLDEVCEIPLEEVCAEYDFGDGPSTMIVLSLQGELGGDMILSFDDNNGRRLAATLLKQPLNAAAEWTPLEKSALMETGNILGCAYMNALTRLVGTQLVPSPPTFLQDYGASVLQQALVAQAMTCEKALICRTRFEERGAALDWNVFFVPSDALRAAMQDALDN